jgi:hypothetical protein
MFFLPKIKVSCLAVNYEQLFVFFLTAQNTIVLFKRRLGSDRICIQILSGMTLWAGPHERMRIRNTAVLFQLKSILVMLSFDVCSRDLSRL